MKKYKNTRKQIKLMFELKKANEKKINSLNMAYYPANPKYQKVQKEIRILQKDIIAAKKGITQMLDEEAEIWKEIRRCKSELSQIIKVE